MPLEHTQQKLLTPFIPRAMHAAGYAVQLGNLLDDTHIMRVMTKTNSNDQHAEAGSYQRQGKGREEEQEDPALQAGMGEGVGDGAQRPQGNPHVRQRSLRQMCLVEAGNGRQSCRSLSLHSPQAL